MNKWKITTIIVFLIIGLPILLFLCFYGFVMIGFMHAADDAYKVSEKPDSVVYDLNNLWGMEFPEEFNSVYVFYNRGGWMGEGKFYAVYECEHPSDEFLTDFTADLNGEVQNRIETYFEYFDYDDGRYNVKLNKQYMPDFDDEFISVSYHKGLHDTFHTGECDRDDYCDDHLYMCYFPQQNRLCIYENIT